MNTSLRNKLWVAALPALLIGCMPDIPQDAEPSRDGVTAVFDPDTATIPLPNSAALEEDGTLPKLAGAGEDSAEGQFLDWLDGLHGWSESTPIVIPFSGPLDPASVTTDNFLMWKIDAEGTFDAMSFNVAYAPNEDGSLCNPDVCQSVVQVIPDERLAFGASYAVAVKTGVKGADGSAVKQAAATFFALDSEPLFDFETGTVHVSVLEDDPETAASLEGLRRLIAPVVAAAMAQEWSRDDIAVAFNWSVAADPFAILDPDTATLPIPNDIALDRDGTFPSAALTYCGDRNAEPLPPVEDVCNPPEPQFQACSEDADCASPNACIGGRCLWRNCAQGQFDAYLDGLHGWPTTTPITLPISAPVDEATITPESVQLWMIGADGPAKVDGYTVALSECGDEIIVTPPGEMNYAAKYFAFATKDLKTAADENGASFSLTPQAAILLALMPHDPGTIGETCEEVGAACDSGGVCAAIPTEATPVCVTSTIGNVPHGNAASVMAIRPLFQPVVAAIEAGTEYKWDDLAAVWAWTTWTDSFVTFDPLNGNIPFPHTLLEAGCPDEENICNLPTADGPAGAILDALRTRDGFSSTAPHWIPTTGAPLDPSSVSSDTVIFAEADVIPPPPLTADEYTARVLEDYIVLDFHRPLMADTLVAGLTTTGLMGSNGFPAQPTPAFVFLRSEFPLVDAEGNRTIREIPSDETAALLEASRQDFEQLFLVAIILGYGRNEVNNAWAFTTNETYHRAQRMRAMTLNALQVNVGGGNDTQTDPPNLPDPRGGAPLPATNLSKIVWDAEFESVGWMSGSSILDTPGAGAAVGATLTVPVDPVAGPGGCEPPYNVAIVQHGLGGHRRATVALANELAARCIATVAIDLPGHGGRSEGSATLHPVDNPANSGDGFLSEDFPRTLAYFMQHQQDLVVLTRLLRDGAFDSVAGQVFSDGSSQIGFVGSSMGAEVGASFVTIEPNIGPVVLNVAGGNFGLILEESVNFSSLLDPLGLEPASFELLQTLHFLQWLAEWADPYTFAPYTVLDPLTEVQYDAVAGEFVDGEVMAPKDVLIQMAVGDESIPNSSTELLARTMGVSLDDTTFPAPTPHGFLFDFDPGLPTAAASSCGRAQMVEWLDSAFTGAAALPPALSATTCAN